MQPDVRGPLEDIRNAARFIAETVSGLTFDGFMADQVTRYAVERGFEIMGEAVNRLYRTAPEIAERISDSRRIVNFRNALAHGYDTIDYATVWRIITESLPTARSEVERLLQAADMEAR
jgi:uncharacterized protein with HEPN domain